MVSYHIWPKFTSSINEPTGTGYLKRGYDEHIACNMNSIRKNSVSYGVQPYKNSSAPKSPIPITALPNNNAKASFAIPYWNTPWNRTRTLTAEWINFKSNNTSSMMSKWSTERILGFSFLCDFYLFYIHKLISLSIWFV